MQKKQLHLKSSKVKFTLTMEMLKYSNNKNNYAMELRVLPDCSWFLQRLDHQGQVVFRKFPEHVDSTFQPRNV